MSSDRVKFKKSPNDVEVIPSDYMFNTTELIRVKIVISLKFVECVVSAFRE